MDRIGTGPTSEGLRGLEIRTGYIGVSEGRSTLGSASYETDNDDNGTGSNKMTNFVVGGQDPL